MGKIKQTLKTIEQAIFKEDDVFEKTFIVTDGCMWEKNKQDGTSHPHAIEVVDDETGQVRFIMSGARIKFVGGKITEGRDQKQYNSQPCKD